MSKAIRVASINNNETGKPRVRLELRKNNDGAFGWFTAAGESCNVTNKTVNESMDDLFASWGAEVWGLKIGSR